MRNFKFPLNEDELFYKKYHVAAQSPQTLKAFLSSVNKKDALRRRLIIPELFPNQTYHNEHDKIISIERYNRYTPAILHKHSDFEILYIFNGQCTQNIGFESLRLQRGDLIFTAPEILHTLEAFDDESIIFEIVLRHNDFYEMFAPLVKGTHIVNKFFAEGLHGKSPIKYLLFHTAEDKFTRENALRMLEDELNADDYTEQFLIGCLILGFVHLMRCHLKDFEMSTSQPLATVTLEKLAEHFNFSVSHCSRLIKAATGLNFNEWRKTLRLNRAEYLLTNTNQRVEEISSAIGYLNAENFIRAFQKEFGMTPAKYRKINKT